MGLIKEFFGKNRSLVISLFLFSEVLVACRILVNWYRVDLGIFGVKKPLMADLCMGLLANN